MIKTGFRKQRDVVKPLFKSLGLLCCSGALWGLILGGGLIKKAEAGYPLIRGAELYELGYSIEALALGGASLGLESSAPLFPDNAAAPAGLLRKDFSLSAFVNSTGRSSFSIGYIHPSDLGVFGVSFYGSLPTDAQEQSDFGSFFSVTGNFSKRLSKVLEFGINVAIDYNDFNVASGTAAAERNRLKSSYIPVGFHVDAALIIRPKIDRITASGFSFRRVRYGVTLRELGLVPIGRSGDDSMLFSETIDPFVFGLGFDFLTVTPKGQKSFLKTGGVIKKGFVSRFLLDVGFSYPVNFTAQGGFKSIVYTGNRAVPEFTFYIGGFYNNLVDTYFPVTGGLSIKFSVPETDIFLKWVWLLEKPTDSFSVTGLTSTISLATTFGYRDNAPPEIDPSIFSGEGEIPRANFKLISPEPQ